MTLLARSGRIIEITTPIISAPQNNYAPPGWSSAEYIRLTTTTGGPFQITGLDSQGGLITPRRRTFINATAGFAVEFGNLNGASAAENQLLMQSNFTISELGDALEFIYDPTLQKWLRLSGGQPSGG
jgi:hypothetical protein